MESVAHRLANFIAINSGLMDALSRQRYQYKSEMEGIHVVIASIMEEEFGLKRPDRRYREAESCDSGDPQSRIRPGLFQTSEYFSSLGGATFLFVTTVAKDQNTFTLEFTCQTGLFDLWGTLIAHSGEIEVGRVWERDAKKLRTEIIDLIDQTTQKLLANPK